MTRKTTEKTTDASFSLNSDIDQAHILHPNKKRKACNIPMSSSHTKKSSITSTDSATLENKSMKETHDLNMHRSNNLGFNHRKNTQKIEENFLNKSEEDRTRLKSEVKDFHPNYELLLPNLFQTTWINCGKFATELNSNYSIAIKCFESAIKYNPSNLETINLLVDSLVNRDYATGSVNGIKSAIDLINSAMVSYPEIRDDTKLWAKLSGNYLLINDIEKAHSVIQTALEFAKNDPLLWFSLGKCLLKMNALKEAVDALGNASFLLPKELTDDAEVNIARNIHLEMASIALNDRDLNSAKDELGLALSLPAPTDSQSIDMCIAMIRHLVVSFERSNDLVAAAWICEVAESKFSEEPIILLLHSYLLLSPNKSLFNPSKARSLLHNIIQKDRYYIKSDNVVDFIQSSNGDFLPWLLLSKCYDFLENYNIAFDCLEISARKITYPAELPIFRSLANRILEASDNDSLGEDVKAFINALDSSPQTGRVIPLMDLILMPYDERINYFERRVSATHDESKSKRRKSTAGGATGKRKIDEVISNDSKISSPKRVYYDLTRDDSLQSNSRASVSAEIPRPPSAPPNIRSTPQIVSPLLSSQVQQQTPIQTQPQHQPQQQQQMYSVIQGPVYPNLATPASLSQPVAFSVRTMPQQQQQQPQQQSSQWAHVNSYSQNKNVQYNNIGPQIVSNHESAIFSPADTNIPTLAENNVSGANRNISNGRLTSPAELHFQQERQYIPMVHQPPHAQPIPLQHQSRQLIQPNMSTPQHQVQMMEVPQPGQPGQPRFQGIPGAAGPRMVGPNGQIIQQVHLIQGPAHNQVRQGGSRVSSNGQGQLPVHGQMSGSIEEQRVQYANAPGHPQMSNRFDYARQPSNIPPPGMVNSTYIAYEQPGRHYIDEQMRVEQQQQQQQQQAQQMHHVQMQVPPEGMQMSPMIQSRGPAMIPGPVSGMHYNRY